MASSIGLARAFTKKVNQKLFDKDDNSFTARLMNKRNNEPSSIDRNMISLPVELIMASNPLAFDAPDLKDAQLIHNNAQQTSSVVSSTPTSKRSFETDGASTPSLSHSGSWTPGSSRLQSPTDSSEPMTYFLGGQQHTLKPQPSLDAVVESEITSDSESDMIKMHNSYSTPAVPKRAPSHTRATHRELARQRSVSRLRDSTNSSDALPRESVRTSAAPPSTTNAVDFSNPFGAELAQVKELVDEFSNGNAEISFDRRRDSETLSSAMNTRSEFVVTPMRSKSRINSNNKKEAISEPIIVDEETQLLLDKGFNIHGAGDYLGAIQELYDEFCGARF